MTWILPKNKPDNYDGKYLDINFLKYSPSGKTVVFQVKSKNDDFLGTISWHAPWRKYCFFCATSTIFDNECLQEIAIFLLHTQQMKRS